MWAWAGLALAETATTADLGRTLKAVEQGAGHGVLVAAAGWEALAAVRAATSRTPLLAESVLSQVGTGAPSAVMERAQRKAAMVCGIHVAETPTSGVWEVTSFGACGPPAGEPAPAPLVDTVPVAFGELRIEDDTLGDEDTVEEIVGRMREAGLRVVEGPPERFTKDVELARYVLHGSVDSLTHDEKLTYREVQLVVDWELQDARTGRPVYRTSTTGYVSRDPRMHTESTYAAGIVWVTVTVPEQDLWAVLDDATDRLLARPALRELLAAATSAAPVAAPELVIRRCDTVRALPAGLEDALSSALTLMDDGSNVGSAVLVSADGWALTAAHVMSAVEGKPAAKLYDGPTFPVVEVRRDERSDVALIKLDGTGFTCSPLAEERPTVGTQIWAVGTPVDTALELSVAQGIVSGVRHLDGFEALQTDASISPGYSGGPMLLADGTIGALTTSKLYGGSVEGIAFGVPPSVVRSTLAFVEGEASDPIPSAGLAPAVRALIEDPPDPSRYGELDDEHRSSLRRGALVALGAGGVTAGAGLVVSGAALAGWLSNDTKTQAQFTSLRLLDAGGATLVVTGGTLAALGGALLATAP